MSKNSNYSDPIGLKERQNWEVRLSGWFKKSQRRRESHAILDEQILHYLTCTDNGKQLLKNLTLSTTERYIREAESPREVLVVMNPDGWVEVFANHRVRPCFYTKAPYDGTAEVRQAAEKVLEEQLPLSLKRLHFPHATDKGPGRVGACQAIITDYLPVRNVHGVDQVFTWEACTNPWPKDERSKPSDGNPEKSERAVSSNEK